uniref:aldo/keto reductase n=1 Tax=Pseudomonas veronii TaxID=76761 RepID=UPI003C7DCE43
SNFDVAGLQELAPPACATNQVPYNIQERGIEFDLLPWWQQHHLPLMAYCPIAQGGELLSSPTLKQIAHRHQATPAQVALAWVVRQDGMIAIPKAVTQEHVRLNAAAAQLVLDEHDLDAIDRVFGAPKRKHPLAMV